MALHYDKGEAIKSSSDVVSKIKERYEKDETDEFLKPIVIGEDGRIKGLLTSLNTASFFLIRLYSGRHTLLL